MVWEISKCNLARAYWLYQFQLGWGYSFYRFNISCSSISLIIDNDNLHFPFRSVSMAKCIVSYFLSFVMVNTLLLICRYKFKILMWKSKIFVNTKIINVWAFICVCICMCVLMLNVYICGYVSVGVSCWVCIWVYMIFFCVSGLVDMGDCLNVGICVCLDCIFAICNICVYICLSAWICVCFKTYPFYFQANSFLLHFNIFSNISFQHFSFMHYLVIL